MMSRNDDTANLRFDAFHVHRLLIVRAAVGHQQARRHELAQMGLRLQELAIVPLLCFKVLQPPETVLAGPSRGTVTGVGWGAQSLKKLLVPKAWSKSRA